MLIENETLLLLSEALTVTRAFGIRLNQFLLATGSVASVLPAYILATSLRESVSNSVLAGFLFAVFTLMSYTYAFTLVHQHASEFVNGFNSAIIFYDKVYSKLVFGDLTTEEVEAEQKLGRDCRKFFKFAHAFGKYVASPVFCTLPFLYVEECFLLAAEICRPVEQILGLTIPMWLRVAGFVCGLPWYWYLGLGALWSAYAFLLISFTFIRVYDHTFRYKLSWTSRVGLTTLSLCHPKNGVVMYKGVYIGQQVALGISTNIIPICHFLGLCGLSYLVYCVVGAKSELFERLVNLTMLGLCGFYGTFLVHKLAVLL